MKLERRFAEVRAAGSDDAPVIEGYSIRFGAMSLDLGGWRETVAPTAIIDWDDVRAYVNHNHDLVLGRQSAGTLKLKRDDEGIYMRVEPPKASWVADLIVSMRRGDITQQSFAFLVLPGGSVWSETADGTLLRTLTNIKLYDVSVVSEPAYEQTDATVRSADEILRERPTPPAQGPWRQQLELRRLKLAGLNPAGRKSW